MIGKFPETRLRRLRKFSWSRNLMRENHISTNDFILAVFIVDGVDVEEELINMPEVYLYSIDRLIIKIKDWVLLGLNAIMLFPRTPQDKKSLNAEEAYNSDNLICRAIKEIKKDYKNLGVITDVALDPYTIHGHDGIIHDNGYVLNDRTVDILCKQALNFARAGADVIAPSDMMDGRIEKIRHCLDLSGFIDVQIMSYAVKFASSYYGPFRTSIGSSQSKPIDKSTYQMDFSNLNESMREIEQDIQESADSIIIKPSMIYLDVIKETSRKFNILIVAYNVSGEYALLMEGVKKNLFDKEKIFYETYISMKRAGAQVIIVYNFDLVSQIIKNFNNKI